MTLIPGTPASRAAALSVLIVAVLVLLITVIGPFAAFTQHQQSKAETIRQQILLVEDAVSRTDALDALVSLESARDWDDRLLEGGSETAAAAAIQSRVQRLAAEAGGRVESFSNLPLTPVADGQLRVISVRFRLSFNHRQLKDFLIAVGQEDRLLTVEALEMTIPRGAEIRTNNDPRLTVSAVIAGFQRNGESPDA